MTYLIFMRVSFAIVRFAARELWLLPTVRERVSWRFAYRRGVFIWTRIWEQRNRIQLLLIQSITAQVCGNMIQLIGHEDTFTLVLVQIHSNTENKIQLGLNNWSELFILVFKHLYHTRTRHPSSYLSQSPFSIVKLHYYFEEDWFSFCINHFRWDQYGDTL